MSYYTRNHYSVMPTGTAAQVLIGPVDISNMDKYSVSLRHENSANNVGISGITIQVTFDPDLDSAGTGTAPTWFTLATTTIAYPVSLAQSAIYGATSVVDNVHRFLRVQAATSSTANAIRGALVLTIGGFQRY